MTKRMQKYLEAHPLYEVYRGWNIRIHKWEAKYLGEMVAYTVDVRVGVESTMASTIEQARQYVDEKIAEGKVQCEDF